VREKAEEHLEALAKRSGLFLGSFPAQAPGNCTSAVREEFP
jgi:hypothetical protein